MAVSIVFEFTEKALMQKYRARNSPVFAWSDRPIFCKIRQVKEKTFGEFHTLLIKVSVQMCESIQDFFLVSFSQLLNVPFCHSEVRPFFSHFAAAVAVSES